MLIGGSITDSLVTLATHVIQHLGYAGETLLVTVSQLIVVPGTEPTLLFSGFNVDTHHLTLIGIILFGILGDVLGASIAYAIGYFGLHEVLSRRGPLHIDEAKIARASRWFDRYGSPVVLVSRLIPVFRSAPPYAAGVVRMPYPLFALMATLGSTIWMTGLALLGKAVGHQWPQWKKHLDYVDYAVVAIIVVALLWWLLRTLQARRSSETIMAGVAGPGSGSPVDEVSDRASTR
jgi:membrane protein DedA with SNARE-associated domain